LLKALRLYQSWLIGFGWTLLTLMKLFRRRNNLGGLSRFSQPESLLAGLPETYQGK